VAFSIAWRVNAVEQQRGEDGARDRLTGFRQELYRCFTSRADALFEVAEAVLCRQERVHMLAELSLEPEHRRGHGGLYDAVNAGRADVTRLRRSLAALPLPAWPDGRIRLAADVSNWLRPDAAASPDRLFCHCYARGKGNAQMIPGWRYSFVVALEPGRASWTLPLDAVRLGPADDATGVTAAQVRDVVGRLMAAGHWRDGDTDILVVFDACYDLTRLAWLLRDLPVEVAGRLRSDRVMRFPAPSRPARSAATGGRRPRQFIEHRSRRMHLGGVTDARGTQDLPDGGWRDCHAEFRQFAVDPAVSQQGGPRPGLVLDQPTASAAGIGPGTVPPRAGTPQSAASPAGYSRSH
jgi:DDE superfamily endonuclease